MNDNEKRKEEGKRQKKEEIDQELDKFDIVRDHREDNSRENG